MTIKIKKQPRETNQSLIRRFSRSIQRSGILLRARKISFKEKPKSRQAKKKAALRREELKKEYEKLKKMAKPE
jgi:ribosomal protein S21